MPRQTNGRLDRLERLLDQQDSPPVGRPPRHLGDTIKLWNELAADEQLEQDAAADAELREWQEARDRASAEFYASRETAT